MRFEKKSDCYLDTKTGLEWSLENYDRMTWQEVSDFTSGLGPGWRLPSIEELLSIVDYTKVAPASSLPEIVSSEYWSGSTYATNPHYAWLVGFYDGDVYSYNKTNTKYARFVRDRGQQESVAEITTIYKEVLHRIAKDRGPITGEDATCFQIWAQEALNTVVREGQPV